jgi:hypothetical protein
MRLLSKEETARRLGISPVSLSDKRYRLRIGLPGTKVGRRLGFAEPDVEKLIARGREKFPSYEEGRKGRP